jgi:predicted GNAT family N-acyltransferase
MNQPLPFRGIVTPRRLADEKALTARAPGRLVLLAPSGASGAQSFNDVQRAPELHQKLLAEMQRLRGSVYVKDGAIQPEQLIDGRHRLDIDLESWHLLVLDHADRISGCMRYRMYQNQIAFEKLTLSGSALADCQDRGHQFKRAVESEITLSRDMDLPFLEIGGWALHEQIRGTMEALRMALASYSLVRLLGGGVAVSTVTRRNGSASILRRLGGRSLEHEHAEVPAYYEPRYDCEMEVLRFYSWTPNPRFDIWIEELKRELRAVPVVTGGTVKFGYPCSARSEIRIASGVGRQASAGG